MSDDEATVTDSQPTNTTDTVDKPSEITVTEIADRVAALEAELADLANRVTENRTQLETKLAKTNKRVTALEDRSSVSMLTLESELSEMERYLTGIDELSPRANASTKRAVALAQNWDNIARPVSGTSREVANIKRDNITAWLEEAMSSEDGADVSYSPKQVHRSMQTCAELFGDVAEYRKGENGARELVIEEPDEILWSPADLDAELHRRTS